MEAAGIPDRREGHDQVVKGITKGLQPYWLQAYLLIYFPVGLFADSRITAVWQQYLLGPPSLLLLSLAPLKAPQQQRMHASVCVGVATGFEIFSPLVWASTPTGC